MEEIVKSASRSTEQVLFISGIFLQDVVPTMRLTSRMAEKNDKMFLAKSR